MSGVALQHGQKSWLAPTEVRCVSSASSARSPRESCAGDMGAARRDPMMDILMLALGFGFFALAIGYTYVCERL